MFSQLSQEYGFHYKLIWAEKSDSLFFMILVK